MWGSPVEVETRRRVLLTYYAYAYEYLDLSLVSDEEFDRMSFEVDLSIDTTRPDLDSFFRTHFNPYTGMWIRNHPDLRRVHKRIHQVFKDKINA